MQSQGLIHTSPVQDRVNYIKCVDDFNNVQSQCNLAVQIISGKVVVD